MKIESASMASTPLNYVSPDTSRPRWRPPLLLLSGIVAVPVFAVAAMMVTVRDEVSQVDEVTGSMTRSTEWCFGYTRSARAEVSPLEMRLKSSRIAWTPSWKALHSTGYSLFGNVTYRGCSSAPAIYSVRPFLQQFVAASTDAELREFVRVMQSGTEAEQEGAVEAVEDKLFPGRHAVVRTRWAEFEPS